MFDDHGEPGTAADLAELLAALVEHEGSADEVTHSPFDEKLFEELLLFF